jgi:hypothetical protein
LAHETMKTGDGDSTHMLSVMEVGWLTVEAWTWHPQT